MKTEVRNVSLTVDETLGFVKNNTFNNGQVEPDVYAYVQPVSDKTGRNSETVGILAVRSGAGYLTGDKNVASISIESRPFAAKDSQILVTIDRFGDRDPGLVTTPTHRFTSVLNESMFGQFDPRDQVAIRNALTNMAVIAGKVAGRGR